MLRSARRLPTIVEDCAAATRVSLCLQRFRAIDHLRLLLRRHDPSTPFPLPPACHDPFVFLHSLRSAPSPDCALSFFRSIKSHLSSSSLQILTKTLAKTLSLSRRAEDLRSLLLSSSVVFSPIDRLRWYSAAGDIPAALQAWSAVRSSAAALNRRHPCTESYNLVISLFASWKKDAKAVDIYRTLLEEGANPNSRTFTIIIEHLVQAGKLENALQLFDRLPQMRIRRTSKQFNILAEAFSSSKNFDGVRKLLREMRDEGIWPGRGVRSAVALMRDSGFYLSETEDFAAEMSSKNDKIGYVLIASSSSDDEEQEDDDDNHYQEDGIRLKPWMDPNALAKALENWDPREVAAMEETGIVWTSLLVCKFLRGFKKPDSAWRFFCWVSHRKGFIHDKHSISRMIAILARDGRSDLVEKLVLKVKDEEISLSVATVRLVIDFLGISKQGETAIEVFNESQSLCGEISLLQRQLLCSSLLRTLAKCRRSDDVMELLEETVEKGVFPDIQTFSGLVQFFANEGDQRKLQAVATMARKCGHSPDAFMCQVMIRAHIKSQRTALALRVFEDMLNWNLTPDQLTKSLLVKTLWKEGKLREAAYVEQRSEEMDGELPLALPGHVWTVSSSDLLWVYDLYRHSFDL